MTIPHIGELQTAGEVFDDTFDQAKSMAKKLAGLRFGPELRNIAGEPGLRIGDAWSDYPSRLGAEVASTHIYAAQPDGERGLLSVTDYIPRVGLTQPFSV